MTIEIKAQKLLSELQLEFSGLFPFLKLEFFRHAGGRQDRYPQSSKIPPTKRLSEAGLNGREGTIDVTESMTVLQLESDLITRFGLAAQVLRKSGKIWLETIVTDSWSLKQQNDHGRELSAHFQPQNKSADDFDLIRDAD